MKERNMGGKKWKLEDLPLATSSLRRILLNITTTQHYQEEIESGGLPFFTEGELASIEEKFKDAGMRREDIMAIIYKKGWLFKENTLKHYIQKDQLPRAVKRERTNKGMISFYPPTMIRHLNFVRYCLFAKDKSFDSLFSLLKNISTDDKETLAVTSLEIDNSADGEEDCFQIMDNGVHFVFDGIELVKESIENAFAQDESKKEKYLQKVNEIEKYNMQVLDRIEDFEKMLKKNTTSIDLDRLTKIFSKD